MTTNPAGSNYAALVAEAEAAVAAVKDPELRRVAFEKILATLLEGKPKTAGAGRKTPRVRKQGHSATPEGHSTKGGAKGPKAQVEALIDDDFFKDPRTIAEVKAELANRGHHIAVTSLSGPLQTLTQDRRLRRQKMPTKNKGAKPTYAYSNW